MRVLVACEFSGIVRDEFAKRGHNAWSCDLLPSERPGQHVQCDIAEVLGSDTQDIRYHGGPWDLLIAFPPCTYLTRSGWHWVNKPDHAVHPLKGEPRRQAAFAAAEFFRSLLNARIHRICIENPRPISHVNLPPHTQKIHPWQFGHGETKETLLWLKNLPKLVPTNIVPGREARIHKMAPSATRSQDRSRTFIGIGKAMAEQWSNL